MHALQDHFLFQSCLAKLQKAGYGIDIVQGFVPLVEDQSLHISEKTHHACWAVNMHCCIADELSCLEASFLLVNSRLPPGFLRQSRLAASPLPRPPSVSVGLGFAATRSPAPCVANTRARSRHRDLRVDQRPPVCFVLC